MEGKYTPKAVDDITFLVIALKYVAGNETSMRSLAREYGIAASTVWNYIHNIRDYDYRLAELVNAKINTVYNEASKKNFKIAKPLGDHLNHVISKLIRRTTIPADISTYIWDEYITKKCNH